jgi:hypothetical protein
MLNAQEYSPELWSISSYQVDAQLLACNAFSKISSEPAGCWVDDLRGAADHKATTADVGEMSAGDLSVFGLVLLVGSAHKVEYRQTKTNQILK